MEQQARHGRLRSVGRQRVVIAAALLCLFLIYVFQRLDYLGWLFWWFGIPGPSTTASFVFNRTLRLVMNDSLCLILINIVFQDVRFSKIAWIIFWAELIIILPLYMIVKLWWEGPTEISSPLLSPVHRMIINPLLMIILIASFYFQRWKEKKAA